MSKQIDKNMYQVWITDYPINGEAKGDPGYSLVGTFDALQEAYVEYDMQFKKAFKPIITRLVRWRMDIKEY